MNSNKPGQKSKKNKYIIEQTDLVKKIIKLLKLTQENKIFTNISVNGTKEIVELIPDIKKYFPVYKWSCFHKEIDNDTCIPVIKHIFKDFGIKFISYTTKIKIDGKFVNCTCYEVKSDLNLY